MRSQQDKVSGSRSQANANTPVGQSRGSQPVCQLQDNRPQANAQLKLQQAAHGRGVVQRNEKSESLMSKMITPDTFPVPDADVQNRLLAGLEKSIIEAIDKGEKSGFYTDLSFIGAIELKLPTSGFSLNDWISGAQLVNLKSYKEDAKNGHMLPPQQNSYDLIEGAKLKDDVIRNTLATMEKAKQLDYLRESGLLNGQCKVLVEVHYYRDRDPKRTGLHKDTLGQTLFVNLNFVNDQESAGPEFIVNPYRAEEYKEYVEGNLPPVFVADLNAALGTGEPQQFGASRIPVNGVVAFVDEAIHHKTPTLAHRTVTSTDLKAYRPEEYADAEQAYKKYEKRGPLNFSSFKSYLEVIEPAKAEAWYKILKAAQDNKATFSRVQLATIMAKSNVERLLELNGSDDFNSAGIPVYEDTHGKMPVKKKASRPPLERQMSQELLAHTAPKPVDGKRTFFRTWVRALPI